MSYTIIIVKFLYDCLKIEFKAKIKYLKFDLYGIIIVTNGTFIYMKGVNQNQLIFFFPIFEIGGVEKNFFIISDFFTKKLNNYNLSLLTSKRSHLFKKNLNKKINLITLNDISSLFPRRFQFILCMILLFFKCILTPNSIIFSFQGNFYALLVAYILNKKIIIRSNVAPEAWSKNFFKKIIFKFLLSKSNLIIVNSLEFKKKFKEYFNLDVIKIFNPISLRENYFHKKFKFNDFFFKKNTINLINIGRLVVQKNQSEIINALCKVKNKKKFRLLIIGKGPEKKKLIKLIKDKNLSKIIKISNNQKAKYFYLKKSDIFILSSLFEGLPNVLLEAAINKKYIISSNCPTGPKEILKVYRYGQIYKLKSENQLAGILNKISLDKSILDKHKKKINLKNIMFNSKYNLNEYYLNFIKVINQV